MGDWLLLQNGIVVYIVLFLLLMGGAVGLPIPEDLPLLTAGILVQAGRAKLSAVMVVCYAGILIGDLIVYFAGRRFGMALFKSKWFRSRVPASRIKNVRLKLERRSILMIFLARHLFYLRTVTFLTCGAVRMDLRRFIFADAAAALISMPLMLGLGYLAADNYEMVLGWVNKAKTISLVLGMLVVAGVIFHRIRKKTAQSACPNGDEDPVSEANTGNNEHNDV